MARGGWDMRPVETLGGRRSGRLVRQFSDLAAPHVNHYNGDNMRESRRRTARNTINEHLLQTFGRVFVLIGALLFLGILAQIGVVIWFYITFTNFRNSNQMCASLEAWSWVFTANHIYAVFFHKVVKRRLGEPTREEIEHGQQRPLAPKVIEGLYIFFNLSMCVVGLVWASDGRCADTAPELQRAVKTVSILSLCLLFLTWCGLVVPAFVLLRLVRAGILTNESTAAPAGTVEELETVAFPDVDEDHNECCICLTEFAELTGDDDGQEIKRTGCGHYFHKQCLGNWLKSASTCPLCRADVSSACAPEVGTVNSTATHFGVEVTLNAA